YASHARDLPWRRDREPYHVWLSEIMLQQTRVEAARGYYLRFLDAFPTLRDLAAADEARLLKLWEGLGYYSRARNLQKAARVLCDEYGGVFPDTREALEGLPASDYTAGAVASICFERPCRRRRQRPPRAFASDGRRRAGRLARDARGHRRPSGVRLSGGGLRSFYAGADGAGRRRLHA
ncbi:MAG: hypothetical protein ACLUFV_13345, partial [Acutalibacteraceae bacterium]